jgi:hypothetical protein
VYPAGAEQYITLHYIKLYHITLHYITLHYITLQYITSHYITLQGFQDTSTAEDYRHSKSPQAQQYAVVPNKITLLVTVHVDCMLAAGAGEYVELHLWLLTHLTFPVAPAA